MSSGSPPSHATSASRPNTSARPRSVPTSSISSRRSTSPGAITTRPSPPSGSSTGSPSVGTKPCTASPAPSSVTLGRDEALHRIACPKQPKKLPVVLSPEEVVRFFQAVPGLKHRALLMTAYAAGLRISEVVALRVEDVDSRRMVLRVRQGKGRKDRYVMLSPRLLEVLRAYWKAARPAHWLFPGQVEGRPLTAGTVHRACVQASRAAGLGKHVTVHAAVPLPGHLRSG